MFQGESPRILVTGAGRARLVRRTQSSLRFRAESRACETWSMAYTRGSSRGYRNYRFPGVIIALESVCIY